MDHPTPLQRIATLEGRVAWLEQQQGHTALAPPPRSSGHLQAAPPPVDGGQFVAGPVATAPP